MKSRFKLELDEATSKRLGKQRQQGTKAELIVRRIAHGLGLRFRVFNRDLPGSPDLANRSKRWAVFVHGCYWHSHHGCERATVPKRNRKFWLEKFEANRARDTRVLSALKAQGWIIQVVWECETRSPEVLQKIMRTFQRRLNQRKHAECER